MKWKINIHSFKANCVSEFTWKKYLIYTMQQSELFGNACPVLGTLIIKIFSKLILPVFPGKKFVSSRRLWLLSSWLKAAASGTCRAPHVFIPGLQTPTPLEMYSPACTTHCLSAFASYRMYEQIISLACLCVKYPFFFFFSFIMHKA